MASRSLAPGGATPRPRPAGYRGGPRPAPGCRPRSPVPLGPGGAASLPGKRRPEWPGPSPGRCGSTLLRMADGSGSDHGDPRWEYKAVWRYGPISLIVIGAAVMAIGLSGLCATAVSGAALPVALVCLLAGVALPRTKGIFTAGPHGISSQVIAPHQIDVYSVTGPATAALPAIVGRGEIALPKPAVTSEGTAAARGEGAVTARGEVSAGPPVMLGDVWDALEARIGVPDGFRDLYTYQDNRYLEAPDGRTFGLANRGVLDWLPASGGLLELLGSWGVRPVASGRYPVPDKITPRIVMPVVARAYTPESAEVAAGRDDAPVPGSPEHGQRG
jgi:hypothetical protein